jgi:hypothetical protein
MGARRDSIAERSFAQDRFCIGIVILNKEFVVIVVFMFAESTAHSSFSFTEPLLLDASIYSLPFLVSGLRT